MKSVRFSIIIVIFFSVFVLFFPKETKAVLYALAGDATACSRDFFMYAGTSNSWTQKTSFPEDVCGGASSVYANGYIYAFSGNYTTSFYRYSISGNIWERMADFTPTSGSHTALVYTNGNYIYAMRNSGVFYQYSISGNSWVRKADVPNFPGPGLSMTYPGSGNLIYALIGANTKYFYTYNTNTNVWTRITDIPEITNSGASLTSAGIHIYALIGNITKSFYQYNPTSGVWARKTDIPSFAAYGANVLATSSSDFIFALPAYSTNKFYRYSISGNSWLERASLPVLAGRGASLVNVPFTAPNPPTGLSATTISRYQINLAWTAPVSDGGTRIIGYKIERSVLGVWSTVVANTGNTNANFQDTGLSPSTTYTYRVSAINGVGTSNPSNTASATTLNPAAVPGIPTGLSATTISRYQINLAWTAPVSDGGTRIIGYKIERSVLGVWSTVVANTGNTNANFQDTGLSPSTTYTYRVSAINGVGTSNPSNTASATTSPIAVPGSPTDLEASVILYSQVNLSWLAPADNGGSSIIGYRIERSISGGPWSDRVANTGNTNTNFQDTGLSPSTDYTYRVSAINSAGAGPTSLWVDVTTPAQQIPGKAVMELTVTIISVRVPERSAMIPAPDKPDTEFQFLASRITVTDKNNVVKGVADFPTGLKKDAQVTLAFSYDSSAAPFKVFAEIKVVLQGTLACKPDCSPVSSGWYVNFSSVSYLSGATWNSLPVCPNPPCNSGDFAFDPTQVVSNYWRSAPLVTIN